jgi:hypothetical protein
MQIAMGGEFELAEPAGTGFERGEQSGHADRCIRARVEGEQHQLEMHATTSCRGRDQAGDGGEHVLGHGSEDLPDLATAFALE